MYSEYNSPLNFNSKQCIICLQYVWVAGQKAIAKTINVHKNTRKQQNTKTYQHIGVLY